jgi:hypothetical protein
LFSIQNLLFNIGILLAIQKSGCITDERRHSIKLGKEFESSLNQFEG